MDDEFREDSEEFGDFRGFMIEQRDDLGVFIILIELLCGGGDITFSLLRIRVIGESQSVRKSEIKTIF